MQVEECDSRTASELSAYSLVLGISGHSWTVLTGGRNNDLLDLCSLRRVERDRLAQSDRRSTTDRNLPISDKSA